MKEIKRLLSAIEWGLFYGFFTWILGTAVSKWIPGWGVWLIIFNRIFIAIVIHYTINLSLHRWVKGLLIGLIFSLPLGLVAVNWRDFTFISGMIGAVGTGMISGVLMANVMHRKEEEDENAEGLKSVK